MTGDDLPVTWVAEERFTWVLPSGERRPGRIAIGMPVYVENDEGAHTQCAYALDGIDKERLAFGEGPLQAMWHAWQIIGLRLYMLFADGVRVLRYPPEDDDPEDPQGDTASFIGMLGPVVRAHGNLRGPADPEGKLADLEALHEEQMRKYREEHDKDG